MWGMCGTYIRNTSSIRACVMRTDSENFPTFVSVGMISQLMKTLREAGNYPAATSLGDNNLPFLIR